MAEVVDIRARTGYQLLLPIPPSVNAMYTNARGRGRVKSARYTAWLTEAGHLVNRHPTCRFDCPVAVHVDVRLPDKRTRDIDNLLKPLLDLVGPKGHQLIQDDSAAILQDLSIKVCTDPEMGLAPGWVRMRIRPLEKPA